MLVTFLERGNEFSLLSRTQLLEVEEQFLLYLLRAIKYNDAVRACDAVLDDDQLEVKALVRRRMSQMIWDHDCNCIAKPAILRLAAGDTTGFDVMHAPVERTRRLLAANRLAVDARLNALVYPVNRIGPTHLKRVEVEHLDRVRSHARRYVSRRARFLTMGDSAVESSGILVDLEMLALRAMRSYYPFRKGLHMENTMRQTITNRGRSFVNDSVQESKKRVMQNPDGSSVRREVTWVGPNSTGQSALEAFAPSDFQDSTLELSVKGLSARGGTVKEVCRFVLDEMVQDQFVSWAEDRLPSARGSLDVADVVRSSGKTYSYLLARFLGKPENEVESTLGDLRMLSA